jgi:hypothetical protein
MAITFDLEGRVCVVTGAERGVVSMTATIRSSSAAMLPGRSLQLNEKVGD